jgi:predicted nucleic acid-binding protein
MRFWDASALVPLLVAERDTAKRERQLLEDPAIVAWWGSAVECASALNRLARDGHLTARQLQTVLRDLESLAETWTEVVPSARLRTRALRLLRVHALRAADALQLSACLDACDRDTAALAFLCADARLCEAAEKEGLRVLA